jgi:hypothetical protein
MPKASNKYLIAALLLGVAFHGTTIFFTLETTYDALIHLFFADHYANSWFEPWNYKWYTGFTVMSYPPLVHQTIALFSFVGGLKFGLFTVTLLSVILFITGVYRFSLLLTGHRIVAGYATLLAVFSSSFAETLHVFGQLPSIIGIAILMHSFPEIYLWLKTGKYRYLFTALSLLAVNVTSHHVTPVFGMIFFVFPLIGMAIMDHASTRVKTIKEVTLKLFLLSFKRLFKRIMLFGFSTLFLIVGCILPYWINSKNNPITQVPIPHGSRDHFLEVTSSGLVFFLIPWGILLLLLPYVFYRFFSKRYLFFGLSFAVLVVLGTGSTTPIPRFMLGETAFNILTLDRFTLWASIMALPIFGEFVYRFVEADLKGKIQRKFGAISYRLLGGLLVSLFLFMTIFTMSLGYFRPSQPQQIKMLPIVNFLNQDNHDKWRFLTLGFGDQMAWLSAQTNALSVDGNYHSARRLPELTTRPIERLENSKFKGVAGIGSLQQFLTTPEKYHLKYIFSNDKFYDPILYFCGWQRLRQLENGIQVWEKLNVAPIAAILPKEDVAKWQKILWGTLPFLILLIAFVLNIQMLWIRVLKLKVKKTPEYFKFARRHINFSAVLLKISSIWAMMVLLLVFYGMYLFYLKNDAQRSPENVIMAYYDALDFKEYEIAYSYMNPKSNMSLTQFMLEISITDGLLGSYAKLDALETIVLAKNDSLASLKVIENWITPLDKIKKIAYRSLVKINGNWYVTPEELDFDLPPNQLYSNNTTNYFNHGRRRITTEQTYNEDVLKQPVLEILSARLVKFKNSYAVIGEVQNIDNVPADVVLKGTLYNEESKELATYNAKYHVKHKLMPKEITSFKINFEGIAWSKIQDSIPKTFNPDQFTPQEFEEQPTKFNLQAAGNVSSSDLFKSAVLSDLEIGKTKISGTIFNSGVQEITVPQLLISYYNTRKELVWVDHLFMEAGIRQERKQNFEYPILKEMHITIINDNMDNCFVNGLPNKAIVAQIIVNRNKKHLGTMLQETENKEYPYLKIETNSFIGNPN